MQFIILSNMACHYVGRKEYSGVPSHIIASASGTFTVVLLEIRSQNHHLAKTLLDLNMEMRRLRNENELSAASESKALNIAISPE
ncbi:hypothetical protein KIL84_012165 [Mauremys mutica]|uniref:Uncharacterized protein n=1 Tax=Mauremys mutica TaxID=74926 RepID=A0A9D3XFL1_9SAUR|nr:hypothetical protein KIL84_012165 [Mauremys mutica]